MELVEKYFKGYWTKLGIDKDMVAAVLEEMGLSATVRGEALSLAQFAEFTDRVLSHK